MERYGLLAVGGHEPLDEVHDVARLGLATLGQLVGQFGLRQPVVGLAGLLLGLLGFFPLDALGFPCRPGPYGPARGQSRTGW